MHFANYHIIYHTLMQSDLPKLWTRFIGHIVQLQGLTLFDPEVFGVNSSNSNFPRSMIAVFNWSALSQVYVLKKKKKVIFQYLGICMYSLHIYVLYIHGTSSVSILA